MNNKPNKTETAALLRQKAEEAFKKKPSRQNPLLTQTETIKLLHELEVHQIELEMQNEEIQAAREQAERLLDKYTELYDFIPLGYFTLSRTGTIQEVNLSGSIMLAKERSRLMNNMFTFFVSDDSKPVFRQFFENVFSSKKKEICEIAIIPNGEVSLYAHVSGVVSVNGDQCFLTIVDITKRTQDEERLKQNLVKLEIYRDATVGREVRMVELKKEIEELKTLLGSKEKS